MNNSSALVGVAQLQQLIQDEKNQRVKLRIFDCTGDLMNPENGPLQYRQQHIPGALYADLNLHLSAHGSTPKVNAGRHPLPTQEIFANWLGSQGVDNNTTVVVYDRNGVNYAGRLWWMLRWCGHQAVQVLDGGLQAWIAASLPVHQGEEMQPTACHFAVKPALARLKLTDQVAKDLGSPSQVIIDARATPRFKGEVEPIDPVAGHIPGALNRPFSQNLGADGKFKPAEVLKAEFLELLAGRDPASVVHHCGSGVSAVPNIIAMEVAGLATPALYAGSWSEWCTTPGLPCEKG